MGILKIGGRTYTANTQYFSDRGSVREDIKDGVQDVNSYVYMKQSKRLYDIRPSTVKTVNPVNGSFYQVLFGK